MRKELVPRSMFSNNKFTQNTFKGSEAFKVGFYERNQRLKTTLKLVDSHFHFKIKIKIVGLI